MLKEAYRKRAWIKSLITEYSEYLEAGRYYVNDTARTVCYMPSEVTLEFIEKNILPVSAANSLRAIIKSFLKKLIIQRQIKVGNPAVKAQSENRGQMLMVSRGGGCKIFDFKSGSLITFDGHISAQVVAIHDWMKSYYNSPYFNIDVNKKCCRERIIEHVSYKTLSVNEICDLYQKIVNTYIRYSESVHNALVESVRPRSYISKLIAQGLVESADLNKITDSVLDGFWATIPTHGDMVLHNFLITKDDVYLIDYEHAGQYLFYSDLFYPIAYHFINDSCKELYDGLVAGMYDNQFSALFGQFGKVYDPAYIKEYAIMSYLERIYKAVCRVDCIDKSQHEVYKCRLMKLFAM